MASKVVTCPNCERKFTVSKGKKKVTIGKAKLTLKTGEISCPDCGITFRA